MTISRLRHAICVALVYVLLLAGRPSSAWATPPSFQGLGDLPGGIFSSVANGVSTDGSVVVGIGSSASSGGEAFRWTAGTGMVGLGKPLGGASSAYGVSADGAVVVGDSSIPFVGSEAFRWTSGGGMVGLGQLPGGSNSSASGVSPDGAVVVGWGIDSSGSVLKSFRWTSVGGLADLGHLPGGSSGSATGVSADGSVVVGIGESGSSGWGNEAFRWTAGAGMIGLGYLPGGGDESEAYGVSADGSVVVGLSDIPLGYEAFRWTSGGGMIGLGQLSGGNYSQAYGVSADGSVVVGIGISASGSSMAFVWDTNHGMRSLRSVLVNDFGLDLTGWTLSQATGISADSRTIVGTGYDPNGNQQAWIATIPEPGTIGLLALGVGLLVRRKRLGT